MTPNKPMVSSTRQ